MEFPTQYSEWENRTTYQVFMSWEEGAGSVQSPRQLDYTGRIPEKKELSREHSKSSEGLRNLSVHDMKELTP